MSTLKDRIESLDETQHAVARAIGTTKQTVSNWISRNSISKSGSKLICKRYGVRAEWLNDGIGDKYQKASEAATIDSLEKEVASAVLNAPQEVQDVIQALIMRYQNDEQDGAETARAIKKLLGI